jgi:8-oxo-dGTP diphosphatase
LTISTDGKADADLAHPQVAVLAVTFRHDEVILVQRKNEPQKGGWGFPGGSIEPGESIANATLRELMEETGTRAEVVRLIDVVEVRECDAAGHQYHFVLIAMLCRYLSGDLVAGDDALSCQWLNVPAGFSQFHGHLIEHVASVATNGSRLLRGDNATL